MREIRKLEPQWDKETTNCLSGVGSDSQKVKQPPDLRHTWLEVLTQIGKAAQKREKQEWAIEKPNLDNAWKLRGIYFIDPEDGEYKETIKHARRK